MKKHYLIATKGKVQKMVLSSTKRQLLLDVKTVIEARKKTRGFEFTIAESLFEAKT